MAFGINLEPEFQIPEQCVKIVEAEGLNLLHRVLLQDDGAADCSEVVARLLANMALDKNLHNLIIDGGK